MFKLNERGAVLSGVFYGILLLFLFLMLGAVIVLGNGRKALRTAKNNAINELNTKGVLVDKIVLTKGDNIDSVYSTNDATKNLADINVSLGSGTKTTVVVTLYNNSSKQYTFSGIKYNNFTKEEKELFPYFSLYNENNDIVINENSMSPQINTVINPYSTLEIPIEFIYNPNVTATTNNKRFFIIFKIKEDLVTGADIKTVNFDSGISYINITSQEYEVNTKLGILPTITRDNYIFTGWYNSGGVRVDSNTKVTNDMTLYARWEPVIDSNE